MKRAKAIQICGTGSGVGKSIVTAALCRIFLQDSYRVCPFKAQNMALNSFVTKERGEIGRAQATQALACRIEPTVDMNPILIKPTSDVGAQVIVRGKPIGNMRAIEYANYKNRLKEAVRNSFRSLQKKYEIVVIEGAGSPAEVNLKRHDLANMKMAKYANAPVILVGDIDKGGVFAWLVGTLELLTREERKRIKGIIINKFRGDKRLLSSGIDFLEKKTNIKVLGVIPYFKNINLPEEDSVFLNNNAVKKATKQKMLSIAVIHLPHISNFTDFDPLQSEPDVNLRYIRKPEELNRADIIIIPGTKNTIEDLRWLKQSGLADGILTAHRSHLIGICGGYQMLGRKIYDRHCLESNRGKADGLGILPIETYLEKNKVLNQVKARDLLSQTLITGYEIHHGRSALSPGGAPAFEIIERSGKTVKDFDGIRSKEGRLLGTYIHGLFNSDAFRRDFLNRIRQRKGWGIAPQSVFFDTDRELNRLAKLLRENMDLNLLYEMLGLSRRNKC